MSLTMAAVATASLVLAAACSWSDDRQAGTSSSARSRAASGRDRLIHGFGVGLSLPPTWYSRLYAAPEHPDAGLVVLHAATIPLPRGDDVFGTRASRAMEPHDVRVLLLEFPAQQVGQQGFRHAELPLRIGRADLLARAPVPKTHALERLRVAVAGRPFSLFVEFGRRQPTRRQSAVAQKVIASLTVTARSEGDPALWRGLRRPLHVPRVLSGKRCPRSPTRAAPSVAPATGTGPAFAVLGAAATADLRDDLRSGRWYLHKTLWAISADYAGPLLIRGRELAGSGVIFFDRRRVRELRLPPAPSGARRWRYFPSFIALPGPGCFAFQVDGRRFSRVIVFTAR